MPKPFFILAPMDDVTDTVFRQMVMHTAPPDIFFTEFVNVDGLASAGRERLLHKLRRDPSEGHVIAQIWGKIPENYYQATKDIMAMGYSGVDINMGCPDKTVIKNGCCSALINNRELAGEIIRAVQAAAGDVPFPISVKTRLGFGVVDLSWHEYLLSFNLNMLTIHGRTVRELSTVPAHWDMIEDVRKLRDALSPTTLVVGNGDVMSREQGLASAEKHGLDGIMVGRGVFHDPYVFAERSPWTSLGKAERINLYRRHIELFAQTWQNGERRVVTLNKFCKIYINGFDGAKELREQLMECRSTHELLDILQRTL